MVEKNDWRLFGQEQYLMQAKLRRESYRQPLPYWDHDHCAFCFDKFSEADGDLHEGYCTEDHNYWICPTCFEDFKSMFQFNLIP